MSESPCILSQSYNTTLSLLFVFDMLCCVSDFLCELLICFLQMMSTFSYSPMAPVRPGLDSVVQPKSPFTFDLFNKPLPAPPEDSEISAMWSDSDSDSDSTVDSIASPTDPRNSTDCYPIFVSSGSDDFDLTDQSPSDDHLTLPVSALPPLDQSSDLDSVVDESINEPSSLSSSPSDVPFDRPSHWTQNRTGTNHYFREKKWDYFPELAPSAVRDLNPSLNAQKSRKKSSAFEFAKGKYLWHNLDRSGLGGVRDSIKMYVHRTLSRETYAESKSKETPRPSTAPMDHHLNDASSILGPKGWEPQPSLALDTDVNVRAISVATSPGTDYDYTRKMFHLQTPVSPTFSTFPDSLSGIDPTAPRQKQLAVPLSEYQKHGSAIWDPPKKCKRSIQFPGYKSTLTPEPSPSSIPELSFPKHTSPRGVFMGAKKKIVESREDRRRAQLKAQIKLVGPVNPHTCVQSDPWL